MHNGSVHRHAGAGGEEAACDHGPAWRRVTWDAHANARVEAHAFFAASYQVGHLDGLGVRGVRIAELAAGVEGVDFSDQHAHAFWFLHQMVENGADGDGSRV